MESPLLITKGLNNQMFNPFVINNKGKNDFNRLNLSEL
ncbi:hypothetical protein Runsl_3304 [Runella slithyformis DSM 19594]|uniref:Uncharacterized protein n=1 Tax=Runella slithyformis (strain ATCC 29530 / DSM 19594 / LMG 11500 / NCIMB 11436 / LSU 4) TaxID=761193 RepID=A0A7U4E6W1_RUNSL|nr:hypothetical protein Runsl_3304 [Runella slithyformis DSM 19594]